MTFFRLKFKKRRGGVLLHVLIFLVVISILLAGIGKLMVSDYSMVKVENDYANSLVVAEAGINYELRKISNDAKTVDQKQAGAVPGTSYSTSVGTFQVYVTQRNLDGTEPTPWTAGKNLWIYSTGGVNNLTRTVKVAAIAYTDAPTLNYAVFGVCEGVINGSATTVNGDLGTDGFLSFSGSPTINGTVAFNGPSSNWQGSAGSYLTAHNPTAVNWPSVEAIAVDTFGPQGLSYVASTNDNALASPAISNNSVYLRGNGSQTFVGKPGGAHYYLTSLSCAGNSQVTFDNTNGPITLWFGPSGSTSGSFSIHGGTAAIKMAADPSKAVRIYLATSSDVILAGNAELDAGIYNINNANNGITSANGRVILSGTPNIYGEVFANKFTFNGNPTVTAVQGYFSPTANVLYYGCVPPWQEIGGPY